MKGIGMLLGEDGNLLIRNKTVVIGDTKSQEIAILVALNKGEHRNQPLTGAEAKRLVKSRATETKIKRDISEELTNDGFKNISINIEWPEVFIDAKR